MWCTEPACPISTTDEIGERLGFRAPGVTGAGLSRLGGVTQELRGPGALGENGRPGVDGRPVASSVDPARKSIAREVKQARRD